MTEKRFTLNDLDNIQDNNPKGRLYILTERGGVNALCNLINGLNDKSNRLEKENEQLKKTNQELYDELQETTSYKALKMGEVSILKRENDGLKKQVDDQKQYIRFLEEKLKKEGISI